MLPPRYGGLDITVQPSSPLTTLRIAVIRMTPGAPGLQRVCVKCWNGHGSRIEEELRRPDHVCKNLTLFHIYRDPGRQTQTFDNDTAVEDMGVEYYEGRRSSLLRPTK